MAGVVTEFQVPTSYGTPWSIVPGPDGNMWFTQLTGNSIGRITTAGIVTEFPFTTPGAGPFGMAAGVDGNMWFSLRNTSQVGSVGTGFLLGSGR